MTLKDEAFLIYGSGAGDDGILMYSTEANLTKLAECEHWFADGTFDASPLIFHQLYTIYGIIEGQNVSLVYCLLPDKKEGNYKKFLTALKKRQT